MSNPVASMFACIAQGDLDGALAFVADDAVFKAQGPDDVPIYGRFEGREGVRRFLGIAASIFDTEAFEFRKYATADESVFAYGYMQHRVRRTGVVFRSEWALVCEVREGLVWRYRMFEDTAALQRAYGASATEGAMRQMGHAGRG